MAGQMTGLFPYGGGESWRGHRVVWGCEVGAMSGIQDGQRKLFQLIMRVNFLFRFSL